MVCERDEFLWDENPDVRKMLALVFNEEVSGEVLSPSESDSPVDCHTTSVAGEVGSPKHSVIPREVGSVQEPGVVIQEVAADSQGQVGNINKDQGIISEVDGDAACPKVLDCAVGGSEKRDVGELRSSFVERSRRRVGHVKGKVILRIRATRVILVLL